MFSLRFLPRNFILREPFTKLFVPYACKLARSASCRACLHDGRWSCADRPIDYFSFVMFVRIRPRNIKTHTRTQFTSI